MSQKKKKKKKKKKKNHFEISIDSKFSVFEVVLFVLISIIFGMITGCILTYHTSSLSKIRKDSNLNEIVSTYNNIKDYYYDEVDFENLSNNAIKGMIQSLDDPYSVFLDDDTTDNFTESIDGRYSGIGIDVSFKDGYYHIESIEKDSTAEEAGLEIGDIILSIDNIDCFNIPRSDLDNYLRGDNHTYVDIKIKREKEEKEFSIQREWITIQNVSSEVIDDTGYLSIKVFSSNSYEQFLEELKKLEKENINSLIIDVRNNPGGHLVQAKKILELFLSKGKVLYQLEKDKRITKVYSSTREKRDYPIVVLINSSSASAAEVLAISLQENYSNITIMGSTSYGKGTIQKSQNLSTGTSIKYTVEKWLTPEGNDINGKGVIPDIEVEEDLVEKAMEIIKKES